jgi:hypothetical protein
MMSLGIGNPTSHRIIKARWRTALSSGHDRLQLIMQSWRFIKKEVKIAATVANASPPVLHFPCALKRRNRSNLHP